MDEMRVHRLDERTADRLLSGIVRPDDAPPGYAGVAQVLESAGSPAQQAEGTAREAATVASMQAAILGHLVPVPEPGGSRKKMLSKIATIKAAGVAAAVVLGGGTAAAAAGSLPAPAQDAASHVFSSVGIDIPNGQTPGPNAHSDGHANGHATGHTSGDNGSSTGPNSNALPGLCNAASHNGTSTGHPPGKSTVFSTLVCTGVSTPGQSGTNSGGTDSGTEGTEPSSTEPTTPSGQDDSSGPPTSTPASGTAPVNTPDDGSSASSTATTAGSHSHSG